MALSPVQTLKWGLLSTAPYLPPALRRLLVADRNAWTIEDDRAVAHAKPGEKRLLVGPLNTVGEAQYWAEAAALIPGVSSTSLHATRTTGNQRFPADARTSLNALRHSPTWSKRQSRALLTEFTHVLIESASPIMGVRYGRDVEHEVRVLQDAGVKVALLWHGSDIRNPKLHRQLHPYSPFWEEHEGMTADREQSTARNAALADRLGVTEFVATPDLLDYRPGAFWLPTLHNTKLWNSKPGVHEVPDDGRKLPIAVHIPSRMSLKGTLAIREVMETLGDVVEYRELHGITPAQVVEEFANADIVIDQLTMGVYGVSSNEAMSIGRPVIAQVGDRVRNRIGSPVPVVEASAETLAEVVRTLAADPQLRTELGQQGIDYVREFHSAEAVAKSLYENFLKD